jgi:hypothetical protein
VAWDSTLLLPSSSPARFVLEKNEKEGSSFPIPFPLSCISTKVSPVSANFLWCCECQPKRGVRLNEHMEHPEGAVVFQHACKMGLEGRSGWVAVQVGTLAGLAHVQESGRTGVKRQAEEDWFTGAIGCVAFKAPSQSRSGSRSPAFASSMIFCATASRVGATSPSAFWRTTRAISKATPRDGQSRRQTYGLASRA